MGYERAQFQQRLTQISRLITATIEPHHACFPDDDWIRLVREQDGGARATMELLTKVGVDKPVTSLRSGVTPRRGRR